MAKHFSEAEIKGLAPELVSKLDTARTVAGVPFVITSGARTPEENERAMGVESSSHVTGKAVDLACSDSPTRFAMLRGLYAAGFRRIGIYSRHIHADVDESKPQDVAWWGTSH